MPAAASPRPLRHSLPALLIGAVVLATVSACSTAGAATDGNAPTAPSGTANGSKVIRAVAAENFWGSVAAQLGGAHVHVDSIIANPDTDPHDYEPTAADARTVTTAQYVIVNGIGYDAWADRLLSTDPGSGRTELNVGDLVGIKPGGNPHRWYSPDDVHQVIEAITADYKKLDPADAAYFDRQRTAFETRSLSRYDQLVSDIRTKYAGTPIGASESIVTPLAQGLGLTMATPEGFLDAMSEGTDPTAADKAVVDRQIKDKQIKVYVFNSQNSTPDVVAQVKLAEAEGIPVATVTETLAPAGATFQQWQVAQLQGIEAALHRATGK
ncbi:metal ABC transporter solute-binding protein, Zn/Mn family [Streptacidiphilus carbonis]|uniref:metal ABC transporter solute-binding protein, Zn/Mn family n=1 Tax=Streptacidiphilus carbonis TaxID=105422 RepID=UPI0005A95364|nr:zinc ABC transporter substrate-binding protein [Streptacidiphilus carbonis]